MDDRLQAVIARLLENNGGPTGGDYYHGEPDTHVLVRKEDFYELDAILRDRPSGRRQEGQEQEGVVRK